MQAHIMVGHFCVTISLGIEPREYKMITLNYPVTFFISLILLLLLLLLLFLVKDPITLLETVAVQISETPQVKKGSKESYYPAGNYMFKVNNRNTRASYEICSKLTIKTPDT